MSYVDDELVKLYHARITEWRRSFDGAAIAATISYGYPSSTGFSSSGHSTIRHLTGWTAVFGSSILVVTPTESLLIVPSGHDRIYAESKFPWITEVESAPSAISMDYAFDWLEKRDVRGSIGVTGYGEISCDALTRLSSRAVIVDFDQHASRHRMIKDDYAIRCHKAAAYASDRMMELCLDNAENGTDFNGSSLLAQIEYVGRMNGAEISTGWCMFGNRGRTAYRPEELEQARPTLSEKTLFGTYVTYRGYWGHSLRTTFYRLQSRKQDTYNTRHLTAIEMLQEQHALTLEAVKPGFPVRAVQERAIDWINNTRGASLGEECFRQAHFLGLDYSEEPTNSTFDQTPGMYTVGNIDVNEEAIRFEPGMVLELHTNFVHEEFGLMVLGDMYLITDDGYLRLTKVPQSPFS